MDLTSQPLVSIILPVLNAERFVRQALASIHAQTYHHYEIVAVDGSSSDNTAAIVQSDPRVRYLIQAGHGLADAWNTGLAAVRGELICFLDSDDLWAVDKLERQVAFLQAHPLVDYVISHVKLFLEPGCQPPRELNPAAFEGSHIGHMPGTLMARHSVFDRLGGFDVQRHITPDVEWFVRLHDEHVAGAVLPQVLLYRRVHQANLTQVASRELYRGELLRVLKQSLDRRRLAGHGSSRAL